MVDASGEKWLLHTGGSSLKRMHRTGFLINPSLEVISCNPISQRISWIEVRVKSSPSLHPAAAEAVMCFVGAYAPTEKGSSATDVEELYTDLRQALVDTRGSAGCDGVVVLGDFNIHLGDDYEAMGHPSLGGCLPPGPSSRNSQYLVAFCDSEGLAVSQTFQNKGKLEG
jgi:hypothetical protein